MSLQTLGLSGELPQDGFVAVCWSTCALATCFVVAKTVIRLTKVGRLSSDDYWIYFAWAILVTNAALNTAQAPQMYYISKVGAGLISPGPELFKEGNQYVRYEFAVIGLFWTVLWSVKASFLALYYDLFHGHPIFKRVWWVVAAFCFFSYAGCWIASILVCHPVWTYFEFGQCNKPIDLQGSVISVSYSTAVDVISDVMIMLLPLNLIWQIKITTKAKLGLIGCFSLGLVTIVIALVRGVQIATSTAQDIVRLALWSIIESTISVIIGCLPTFKALFSKHISTNGRSGALDYDRYGPRSPGLSAHRASRIPLQSLSYVVSAKPKWDNLTSSSQVSMVEGNQRHDTWTSNELEHGLPQRVIGEHEIGVAHSGPWAINVTKAVTVVSERDDSSSR